MKNKFAAFVVIALVVMGCNTNKNIPSNSETASDMISNTTWELTEIMGKVLDQASPKGRKIHFTLNSLDKTINGYTGCNTVNGKYTLEAGNRIRFSQLASTRMACPDASIEESEVLQVFELADNYTIENGTLMLNVGRRAPLAVFKKVSLEDQIVEKYWKLKTLDGKQVKMAENQEREIYFTLKTDENRVTGFAGCNRFNGTYTLEKGNRIRFSQMLTTMKACPDVDINEAEFLEIFELTDNYTLNMETLSLNVGRRAPLAVFEVVYFD